MQRQGESGESDASESLRRRLLDAAIELLREPDTPLDLRKVAERADKSRTAPYLVFGKGESGGVVALRIAVAAEGARMMAEAMEAAEAASGGDGGDPFESFQAVAAAFLGFVEENPRLFRLIYGTEIAAIAQLGAGGFLEHPEFRALLEHRDAAGEVVMRRIRDAQAQELLAEDPVSSRDTTGRPVDDQPPSLRYLQIAWATLIGVSVMREDDLLRAIEWDLSLEQGARLVAESVFGVDPNRTGRAAITFLDAQQQYEPEAGPAAAPPTPKRAPPPMTALWGDDPPVARQARLSKKSSEPPTTRARRTFRDVFESLKPTRSEETSSGPYGDSSLTGVLQKHPGLRRAAYAPAIKGARILWIDDHPASVAATAQTLRHLGASVTIAGSTGEALEELGSAGDHPIDVIVSDIARDGDPQAGTDAIPRLHAVAPGVPIVFFISAVEPGRGVPKGAIGITNRLDELFHLVVDALEGRGS